MAVINLGYAPGISGTTPHWRPAWGFRRFRHGKFHVGGQWALDISVFLSEFRDAEVLGIDVGGYRLTQMPRLSF